METIVELLILLISEEDRINRRKYLRYLRDTANPFELEEKQFREFFRLPKLLTNTLIQELEAYNLESSEIPFAFRILSTLHFLGNGSYQRSVACNYLLPMSQPSISRNITYICKLMVTNLTSKIKFCEDQEEKNAVNEGFYTKFGVKGVIGAIGCTHVAIVSPPIHDPERPARLYMNRKGYYSINVEAIVDSNMKFLSANAKYPGSVHDAAIWLITPARIHIIQQHNSQRYNWLLGDNGYPLEPWLLTPFTQPNNRKEEKFNSLHIKARNTVERAFGILKSRFRCMNKCRTLHYAPDKAAFIIYSCIILHNMLADFGVNDVDDEAVIYEEEETDLAFNNVLDNSYLVEGRRIRNEYVLQVH